ncbi:sigma-70 family RNA polymerase sigma factor [Paenibacillus methanolicus]|uniref:RNA polymerase sigma factor (Sigma-70 family) n=1 Tax=Paenibacillus methanolicus TaxID=582686 RepID=A0A5S5CBS0_9BACL|nr:sigma-70 family RNA polymerase sigma factor [Paenibacillus methanolicus]TYP76821.1 RNA polymerase sigma factor (sigma-70 family) [Paenibacillus methanolicus]
MEKHQADRVIMDYIKPLFGFALNKTGKIAEAEELAGRITLEVYQALLKKADLQDPNSYIFKIAHYVWARFVGEKTRASNQLRMDDKELISRNEDFDTIIHQETAGLLRREIAVLSHQQREIVVKYYYGGMKISEIAAALGLSSGTVKWHLFEAKKELKHKMNAIRSMGNLGINPIRMTGLGHSGSPGKKGDTADFLATAIRQNIAFAAYQKPLTVHEIAEELGISPVFVKDEIEELEQYGFLDQLPGGKYRANLYIEDPSRNKSEALHRLFEAYAEIAVEEYFKTFFSMADVFRKTGVYIPGGDIHLLLWSLIPYAGKQLSFKELDRVSHQEVSVSRQDGGHYAAFAKIVRAFDVSFDRSLYFFCGDMNRDSDELTLQGWQIDMYWCGRLGGWRDNLSSDFISLMHVIHGHLPQNHANIDAYRRLFDKHYLRQTDSGLEVNIVYCKDKQTGERLHEAIPHPSERIQEAAAKLDEAVYQLNREGQPEHAHKYVRYWSQNSMASGTMRAYILKHLVDIGMLKIPDPHRQKGMCTILFMGQS